jgi:hypothetical protein
MCTAPRLIATRRHQTTCMLDRCHLNSPRVCIESRLNQVYCRSEARPRTQTVFFNTVSWSTWTRIQEGKHEFTLPAILDMKIIYIWTASRSIFKLWCCRTLLSINPVLQSMAAIVKHLYITNVGWNRNYIINYRWASSQSTLARGST